MKSTILRSGVALACALGLAACGGGGDLPLQGLVYGVTEPGLVLQNNGGSDLAVGINPTTGGYTSFVFPSNVSTDDTFNITVKAFPSNVSGCVPVNGSGHANYYTIQQISIQCTPKQHHLVVTVNGLTGSGLILVNGADRQTVQPTGQSPQIVNMADVNQDAPYGVTVLNQPTGQTCTVSGGGALNNGSGTVGADDVKSVVVTCK
jgi:hypothetical protein